MLLSVQPTQPLTSYPSLVVLNLLLFNQPSLSYMNLVVDLESLVIHPKLIKSWYTLPKPFFFEIRQSFVRIAKHCISFLIYATLASNNIDYYKLEIPRISRCI